MKQIRLHLTSSPTQATVEIDGEVVTNVRGVKVTARYDQMTVVELELDEVDIDIDGPAEVTP